MLDIELEQELDKLFGSPVTSDLNADEDIEYAITSETEQLVFDKKEKKEQKKESIVSEDSEKAFDGLGVNSYKKKSSHNNKNVNAQVKSLNDISNKQGKQKKKNTSNKQEPVKAETQVKEKTPIKEADSNKEKNEKKLEPVVETSKPKETVAQKENNFTVEIDISDVPELFEGEVDEECSEQAEGQTGYISHESSYYKKQDNPFSVNNQNKESKKTKEPEIEVIPPSSSKNKRKSFSDKQKIKFEAFVKKAVSFVAMLLVVAGIPLYLSFISNQTSNEIKEGTLEIEKEEKTEQSTTEQTTVIVSTTTESTETAIMQVASVDMNNYVSSSSSGFETLDDLTLYINSQQGVILTEEKTLVSKWNNKTISKKEFLEKMKEQTEALDELTHLLNANKEVYINNDKMDAYATLDQNIDIIMTYGDKAILTVSNSTEDIITTKVNELFTY